MMIRTLSAFAVFLTSLVSAISLYHIITGQKHVTLGYNVVSLIAAFVVLLSFAGIYFILKPIRREDSK